MICLRAAVLVAGVVLTAAGCGGDDDDGASSDKQLKDLTAAELKAECNATKSDFDKIAQGSCRAAARAESDCATAAQSCSSQIGVDCANVQASDAADCTVTVGELRSCLSALAAYFEPISCTQAPSGAMPTCIQSIQTRCSLFRND